MIFGFNTDIKQGDTVYHVQSEARESELLLQTQVFVRGRCIGKRATPYGDKLAGGFTDQQKEHGLRDQHRLVLDAIRDGHLDDILDKRDTPETLAAESVVASLFYPRDDNALGIHVTLGTQKPYDGENFQIPVRIAVPIGKMGLIPAGDKYEGAFFVYVVARDSASTSSMLSLAAWPTVRAPSAMRASASTRLVTCSTSR